MIARALDSGAVYRAWQMPFAEQKFAPVARALAAHPPRSVLDIGCGPGTNAAHFRDIDYVGIDLNQRYVAAARRRFASTFVVGDATRELPEVGAPYDFILSNSLLHHLDDGQVDAVLAAAVKLLAPGGELHILDLELPAEPGVARFLARHDRGDHVRLRADWRELIGRTVDVDVFEPYQLGIGSFALWRMFYCRASPRSA